MFSTCTLHTLDTAAKQPVHEVNYCIAMSIPAQVMVCAYDITITSTHTRSISTTKNYRQPCIHKVFALTKHNNVTLNTYKTICTLFTPDHAEYQSNLDLT